MRTLLPTILSIALLAATSRAGAQLDTAKKHLAEGRLTDAVAAAAEVSERDGDYARARYLMGEVQLALHDASSAAASFEAAAKARPDSVPVLVGLGRARLALDRPKDAVPPLEKAAKKDTKSARAQCFLGIAKWRASNTRRGGREIRRAVRLGADDPEVARALVAHYLTDSDPEGARAVAKRFRAKRRKHPMAAFLDGLTLAHVKKYDDAVDAYERADLGLANPAERMDAYERALKHDESFLDAHKNIAILCIAQNPMYRDKKKTEKAIRHADRYFELGGKDPQLERAFAQLKQFLPHLYKNR